MRGINIGIFKMDKTTNPLYWDCECKKHYIHPKTHMMCPYCGCYADESPDSITEEVEEMLEMLNLKLQHLRKDTL